MTGSAPRQAAAIAGANLRRTFRDRTALFFIVVLPVVIIVVIGSTFGGDEDAFEVGVVDGDRGSALSRELVARLRRSDVLDLASYRTVGGLRRAVRREELAAGLVVPPGYEAALRGGGQARLQLVADPTSDATPAVRAAVAAAVSGQGVVAAAARVAAAETGADFDQAVGTARRLEGRAGTVGVEARTIGSEVNPVKNRFAYTAPSNLVLFVFVNTVATAGALVESRRLGVSRRMLATPASSRTILAGEALGRFAVALVQALLILGVGALLFGVEWGEPGAAAALVVAFVLVSTGAGMLVGAVARTGDQAGAVGAPVGIALGMLGGCMWPLEVVGDTMRAVGHVVPHAWAMDAWQDLVFDRAGLAAVAPELGVLAAWAAALLVVAAWRLHRALTAA